MLDVYCCKLLQAQRPRNRPTRATKRSGIRNSVDSLNVELDRPYDGPIMP